MIDLSRAIELKIDKVIRKIENINGKVLYEVFKGIGEELISGVLPLTLKSCNGENLVDYKIYGNSVQNGTPTTETSIEVESVGERTNNLFNQGITKTATFSQGSNTSARDFEEGVWYVGLTHNNYSNPSHTLSYSFGKYDTKVKVNGQRVYGLARAFKTEPNQKYTIGYKSTVSMYVGFYDEQGNWIKNKLASNGSVITIPENCYWMTVCLPGNESATEVTYSNIQLMLGEEAQGYEPYGYKIPVKSNETVTNIFLDEPLRKIGNYADYIDFKNKKVIRKIYSELITEVDSVSSLSGTFKIFLSAVSKKPYVEREGSINNTIGFAVSNKFLRNEGNYYRLLNYGGYIQSYLTSGGSPRVGYSFNDTGITTVEQAQEKIANGFEVYYVLETPIEETIELPNIPTSKGTTILSADTETQPSNMEVIYIKVGAYYLTEEEDELLNYILSTNTQTEKDISDNEIIRILDEIIGG